MPEHTIVGAVACGNSEPIGPGENIIMRDLNPEVQALLEAALAFYPLSAGDAELSALVKAAETFASKAQVVA